MSWRIADKDELLRRADNDPYIRCEVQGDGAGLVSQSGWVALHTHGGRAGATVVLDAQPDRPAGAALLAAAVHLAAERGCRLSWFTTPDGIELPLAVHWRRGAPWVWMSTTELKPDEGEWRLVELDDAADAEELRAFALPINPLWEGDPGQGLNRYWLGARDDAGRLIGCGTVHETMAGVGHLAGLVVDPAARGQGLGRAITWALSARVLASDGIATLTAYADNTAAIAVYHSVGYQTDHRFRSRFLKPRR